MDPREPAGHERGEGKSAELFAWAQAASGAVGNTYGTVRGRPRGRYPLTETPRFCA